MVMCNYTIIQNQWQQGFCDGDEQISARHFEKGQVSHHNHLGDEEKHVVTQIKKDKVWYT